MPPKYTRTFAQVYLAELDYVKKRRDEMGLKAIETELENIKASTQAGLVGLALSGGGVRSATFNLGLLQSLAKNKVLQYCDYLSTVSGGGYIGSCLSALLANAPKASTKPDEFPLNNQSDGKLEESAQVNYLRQTKNYLGTGSLWDSWHIIGTVVSGRMATVLVAFISLIFLSYLYIPYNSYLFKQQYVLIGLAVITFIFMMFIDFFRQIWPFSSRIRHSKPMPIPNFKWKI